MKRMLHYKPQVLPHVSVACRKIKSGEQWAESAYIAQSFDKLYARLEHAEEELSEALYEIREARAQMELARSVREEDERLKAGKISY